MPAVAEAVFISSKAQRDTTENLEIERGTGTEASTAKI